MNLSLEGRNALICGGSQGIGFAIAEELALMGANCTLIARDETRLHTAVALLDQALRQSHSYHVVDLSKWEEAKGKLEQIVKERNIHILVNNSGGPAAGPIVGAKPEQFINAFQQHVVVSQFLTLAVISGMRQDGYGRIINIISTSVKVPLKNLGVSNTIRGAMASWAKTMANELGSFGITVNNILPGLTKTGRLESLIAHTSKQQQQTQEETEAQMLREVPLGRFAEPPEVAAMAAFLASPAASYVSGTSIRVDGGKTGSI